ncbi:MAG: hypothetical protein HND48_08300 [Chloroflexi bacterium]|nr:hypothetical protein [Chloroflexota bacterium]
MRPEPEQQGERRVTVERPGHTAFLEYAYRAPAAGDDDFYALTILDSILTGPDGQIDNKTSRLYRALVETESPRRSVVGWCRRLIHIFTQLW